MKNQTYSGLFSGNIDVSIKTAASILVAFPDSALAFLEIAKRHKAAEKRREKAMRFLRS